MLYDGGVAGPFSPHHFVLLWLLERELLIEGIEDACSPEGYDRVRLHRKMDLTPERCSGRFESEWIRVNRPVTK